MACFVTCRAIKPKALAHTHQQLALDTAVLEVEEGALGVAAV